MLERPLSPRLLIIDDLLEIKHTECQNPTRVLVLGIEVDVASKFLGEAVPDCVCTTIIDHKEFTKRAQGIVRDFYLNQFPTVARHLVTKVQDRGGDVSRLAYLKFFERTPFDGDLATSLYWLALWRLSLDSIAPSSVEIRLRRDSPLRLVLSTRRNRRLRWQAVLFLGLQLTRFFLFQLSLRQLRQGQTLTPSRDSSNSLFFTIYPHWWTSNGTKGRTERFFPEQLLISGSNTAKYLIWFQGKNFRADQRALRQHLKMDFLVLNEYIKLHDFLIILKRIRDSRILSSLGSSPHYSEVTFHNFDISRLIQKAISASVGKGEFVQSHLVELAMSRLGRYQSPNHVVFRFENQPLDHAIITALRGNSEVATVGYWHTALSLSKNYVSLWKINNFWTHAGLSHAKDDMWPDFMLVPNELCKESLQREGFPLERTREIPPTRHLDLLTLKAAILREQSGFDESKGHHVARVLISLSADKPTSLLLTSTALRCLNLMEGQFLVGIRPHPAWSFSFSEIEQVMKDSSTFLEVIWDMKEMYEWIYMSKTLITPGSQLALESMFLGTLPIVFEPKSVFNPTDFDFFSNACLIVGDSQSLEEALMRVISQDPRLEEVKSNWPDLLDSFLGAVRRQSRGVDIGKVLSVLSGIRLSHD
jgi:hypothetical protein